MGRGQTRALRRRADDRTPDSSRSGVWRAVWDEFRNWTLSVMLMVV